MAMVTMAIEKVDKVFFTLMLGISGLIFIVLSFFFNNGFVIHIPSLVTGIINIVVITLSYILIKKAIRQQNNNMFLMMFYGGILGRFFILFIMTGLVYLTNQDLVVDYLVSYLVYSLLLLGTEIVVIYNKLLKIKK